MTPFIASLLLAAVVFVDGQSTYTVGVIEAPPFVTRDGNSSEPSGYIPDILAQIGELIDAEFSYVWTEKYGYTDDNGEWQGLIREVRDGEVDIGGAALTITAARREVIDFSRPFMSTGIGAAIKAPERRLRAAIDAGFLYRPFTPAVWVLFCICFLLFAVAIFLLNRFHPFEHRAAFSEGKGTEKEAQQFDVGGGFWLASTLTLFQGFDRVPRSKAGKLLMVVFADLVLITIIYYACSMSNMMGSPPGSAKRRAFNSIEEIVQSGEVKMGFVDGGSTSNFFKNSHVGLYERIYLVAHPEPSIQAGLEKVRDGNYAFFMESPLIEHHSQRKPCDIMQVGADLNQVGYGFAFQKGNALRDTFDTAILQMRESGKLQKLYKRAFYERGECGKKSAVGVARAGPPARPVTTREYLFVFIMFLVALIIVALVAVAEVFFQKYKNKPKNRKEILLDAEEGHALNQTTMSALNDTNAEPNKDDEADKEAAEEKPKGSDAELEPEDKDKEPKQEDPDRIEPVSGPVEVKA